MMPSTLSMRSRRSRRPKGGRRMVSDTLVSGERNARLRNWIPLVERLMLSVVRTAASSRPDTCMASLAVIRGAWRRSRVSLVIFFSFAGPAPRAFEPRSLPLLPKTPRRLEPRRPVFPPASLGRDRQCQLDFAPGQVGPRHHYFKRIPQAKAPARVPRAKRKPVIRQNERRIAGRPLREEALDPPLFERHEQAVRRQSGNESARFLPNPRQRESDRLPPRDAPLGV